MKPTRCAIGKCDQESLLGIPVCMKHGVGIWMAMHDVVSERLERPQGDRLLTCQQVRTMIPALKPATFRSWVSRGQIAPAQKTSGGTPMYWLSDIEANMYKLEGNLRRRAHLHEPVVYYLQLASGRIKIGYTSDLKGRMEAMRYSLDEVLATEPGGRDIEAERHAQFADIRLGRREEFDPSPELLSHIEELAELKAG